MNERIKLLTGPLTKNEWVAAFNGLLSKNRLLHTLDYHFIRNNATAGGNAAIPAPADDARYQQHAQTPHGIFALVNAVDTTTHKTFPGNLEDNKYALLLLMSTIHPNLKLVVNKDSCCLHTEYHKVINRCNTVSDYQVRDLRKTWDNFTHEAHESVPQLFTKFHSVLENILANPDIPAFAECIQFANQKDKLVDCLHPDFAHQRGRIKANTDCDSLDKLQTLLETIAYEISFVPTQPIPSLTNLAAPNSEVQARPAKRPRAAPAPSTKYSYNPDRPARNVPGATYACKICQTKGNHWSWQCKHDPRYAEFKKNKDNRSNTHQPTRKAPRPSASAAEIDSISQLATTLENPSPARNTIISMLTALLKPNASDPPTQLPANPPNSDTFPGYSEGEETSAWATTFHTNTNNPKPPWKPPYIFNQKPHQPAPFVIDSGSTDPILKTLEFFVNFSPTRTGIQTTNSKSPPLVSPDQHAFVMRTEKRFGLHIMPIFNHPIAQFPASLFSLASVQLADRRVSDLTEQELEQLAVRRLNDMRQYQLRHLRFGHASAERIRYMQTKSTTTDLTPVRFPTKLKTCEICVQSTRNMAPSKGLPTPTQRPGHMLFFDVLQINPPHNNKFPYILLGADQGSTFNWHAYCEHKDEPLVHAIRIVERLSSYYDLKVGIIRLDPGELGSSLAFREYCDTKGIDLQQTARKTPSQDGGAERPLQTLVNMTRALSIQAKLPSNRWGLAFDHAVYLKNILPVLHRQIPSPIEALTNTSPRVSHIRAFGCLTWYRLHPTDIKSKLEPRSRAAVYVGCQSPSLVILVDKASSKVLVRLFRDCVFDENSFPGTPAYHPQLTGLSEIVTGAVDNSRTTTIDSKVFNAVLRRVLINEQTLSDHTLDVLRNYSATPSPHYSVTKSTTQPAETGPKMVFETSKHHHTASPLHSTPPFTSSWPRSRHLLPIRHMPEVPHDLRRPGRPPKASLPQTVPMPSAPSSTVSTLTFVPIDNSDPAHDTTPVPTPNDPLCLLASAAQLDDSETSWLDELPAPTTADSPSNRKQAMAGPNKQHWLDAESYELQQLETNNTYTLVNRTASIKCITCRWVYKCKLNQDGSIERFRARLVARGFLQRHGYDYMETYSPVMRIATFRWLLALAALNNWQTRSADFSSAFLYGVLDTPIYMLPPDGYNADPTKIWLLNKAIYGLKQAGRVWFYRLTSYLKAKGYQQSRADPCVFFQHSDSDSVILSIYVDDLAMFGTPAALDRTVATLRAEFKLRDLGELSHFVGMQIARTPSGFFIHQRKYISEILERFQRHWDPKGLKRRTIPIKPGSATKPATDSDTPFNPQLYLSATGSLNYASILTRPDIATAVSYHSTHNRHPTQRHWDELMIVFQYLAATSDHGIHYNAKGNNQLTGYADAAYHVHTADGKSQLGYVTMLADGAVSWKSSKSVTVALSSTEAEYMAISELGRELLTLVNLHRATQIPVRLPISIFEDNLGTIAQCTSDVYTHRSKHVAIRYHFIRELVQLGTVVIFHISTKMQPADLLTKPLEKFTFRKFCLLFGLKSHRDFTTLHTATNQ
ncbi:DNA-directed DNA polymerase [Chytriomyces confervae]|uniref:DNA-directed DNA polymerase n=1 Tax=Chytriomyces confervae TaxID=246404 RepID=A0A507FH27_9FUNG|nr:DNA-directed DNA polymerase [Chytriomyces confervae]